MIRLSAQLTGAQHTGQQNHQQNSWWFKSYFILSYVIRYEPSLSIKTIGLMLFDQLACQYCCIYQQCYVAIYIPKISQPLDGSIFFHSATEWIIEMINQWWGRWHHRGLRNIFMWEGRRYFWRFWRINIKWNKFSFMQTRKMSLATKTISESSLPTEIITMNS